MTARDDLNKQVQEYLRIAYEGKWVILSIFIVVVTATWLYTMVQDDIYRAGVSVRLKPSKDLLNSNVGAGGLEGLGWAGEVSPLSGFRSIRGPGDRFRWQGAGYGVWLLVVSGLGDPSAIRGGLGGGVGSLSS